MSTDHKLRVRARDHQTLPPLHGWQTTRRAELDRLASELSVRTLDSLVIFNNTASPAGVDNALALRDLLEPGAETPQND